MSAFSPVVDGVLTLSKATGAIQFGTSGSFLTLQAAAPVVSHTLTIRDPGADANILLSQGTQIVTGITTFAAAPQLTAAANQLVILPTGSTGFAYTINATGGPAANRTLTIKDDGQAGNFMIDGSGGAATQGTDTNTAVILHKRAGLITMQAACLATGSVFALTNNYIVAGSQVLAWSQNTLCATSSFPIKVVVSAIGAGTCTITVSGDGTHASAAAPIVQFLVI